MRKAEASWAILGSPGLWEAYLAASREDITDWMDVSLSELRELVMDRDEVTGTSRGNTGCPAATRERHRESFFNAF